MQTDLIIIREYCERCHVEPSFIVLLKEGGLINITIMEGEEYLDSIQLHDLERYTRMYYDLSINIEGIDAIHHLLNRIESMQHEIAVLRTKLNLRADDENNPEEYI
ncbi:MAG: chaperone modulator CbpM [Tannerellaceae bacterium]